MEIWNCEGQVVSREKTRVVVAVMLGMAMLSALGDGRAGLSADYQVSVDGRAVEVWQVPAPTKSLSPDLHEPYSYAMLTATGRCEVTVVCALTKKTEKIVMTPPETRALEMAGRDRALVIAASLPERNAPDSKDKNVIAFGPGRHRAGIIRLRDDQTLYLAPGAWVEGAVVGKGRNMRICGQGVLTGASYPWLSGPVEDGVSAKGEMVRLSGENIRVEDVTLFSSWGWTLVFNGVTNAVADNVKIIGGRVLNDDGIDVCRAKDVVVRNCFIRAQDDSVAPKWWCENLMVSNCTFWADYATAVRIGYECEDGATGLMMRDITFRDIDILHLSVKKSPPTEYWTEVGFLVQPSRDQRFESILFEDIRFHEATKRDWLLVVRTQPIDQGYSFPRAGSLKGLTLRNIHLPPSDGGMGVWLQAHDDAHPIEGVRFEDVTGYGPVTRLGKTEFETSNGD